MKFLRKPFIWIFLLANALLFWVIQSEKNVLRVRFPKQNPELPILAKYSPFALTRENGREFSSKELERHPWIADFIYTRCPNQCPTMTAQLARFQKILPKNVKIVSISVDPSHDSPETLKAFSEKFAPDRQQWFFLTGNKEIVLQLMSDLKLGKSEDPAIHSLRYVLMDSAGQARGYYDSEDSDSMKKMLRDAATLSA